MQILITSLLTICILLTIYFYNRNKEVTKFKRKLLHIIYAYSAYEIILFNVYDKDYNELIYDKLNRNNLLFSFKPLTYKNFIDPKYWDVYTKGNEIYKSSLNSKKTF